MIDSLKTLCLEAGKAQQGVAALRRALAGDQVVNPNLARVGDESLSGEGVRFSQLVEHVNCLSWRRLLY